MKSKTLREQLGEKCKKLRKAAKLTQQELADALNAKYPGVTFYRTDISAFERSGNKLGLEKIEVVFSFFNRELTVSEKKTFPTFA